MTPLVEYQTSTALEALRRVGDVTAAVLLPQGATDVRDVVRGKWPNGAIETFVAGAGQWKTFDRLIDAEMVRHAQRFFATFGLQIGAALVHHSLPDSYAAARGAQVLYLTGELVTSPARRVRETTQFVLDIMTPPPADQFLGRAVTTLHPGQRGATAARRIRLFHQCVRNFVNTECAARWKSISRYFERIDPDGPSLGVPLNQEDLLGTLHEFTVAVFESLGALGVPYTSDDEAAWFHVWNIVGRHMGIGTWSAFERDASETEIAGPIRPFLPLDPRLASETLAVIRRRQQIESVEGTILVNALLAELQRPLSRGMKPFPAALMRYLLGPHTADLLGISRGGWFQEFLLSLNSIPRIAEKVARRRTGALARVPTSELSAITTQRLLQTFVDEGRSGNRPFEVPAHLGNAWGLRAPA
jgi:hypothetical protein